MTSDDILAPPVAVVDSAIACTRCGYSLRGLQITGKCPECGWAVESSLRGGLLRFAGPEYLASLALGAKIVIILNIANAVLGVVVFVGVIGMIVTMGGSLQTSPGAPAPPLPVLGLIEASATALTLLATTASLAGYWLLTTPDPALSQAEQPRAARRVVRGAVVAVAITQALGLAVAFFTPRLATGGGGVNPLPAVQIASGGLGLAETVAGAVQFFAMMLYARWLAQRVPDAEMVARTRLYMWLLPVLYTVGACLAVGPLVAWVLYLILVWKLRKQIVYAREQSLTLAAS
jgi:hypothetical protein